MRCVGYDEDFQRSLAAMPPDYIPIKDRKKQDGNGHAASKSKKRGAQPSPGPEGTPKQKRRKIEPSSVDHIVQADKQNHRVLRSTVIQVGRHEKEADSIQRATATKRKPVATNRTGHDKAR
jgi:hypothetical protein